jgi:23S rRNA pseudouridine2605 synthase
MGIQKKTNHSSKGKDKKAKIDRPKTGGKTPAASPFKKFFKEEKKSNKEDNPFLSDATLKFTSYGNKATAKTEVNEKPKAAPKKIGLFDEDYFTKPGHANQALPSQELPKKTYSRTPKIEIIRLSKFVAQSGLCSRRAATELVKGGEIHVNGKKELNPAYEVQEKDVVTHKNKVLAKEEKLIYLLMNKPKNVITTADDEKGRKTVMDLIKDRYEERIYPVGRLDRQTTGLLLLTNDGDLAKKLSHPSHQIKKVYHVILDKNFKSNDLEKVRDGVTLEDGVAEVDAVDYVEGGKKNEVGIELHSGKNRIVRRIFESLGYEVEKLDRTFYGGLTKKDLPRGFVRPLSDKEIIMLKHFTNQRKK